MFKNLLTLLFITMSSILTAQTSIEKELEILETPEQIDSFLKLKNSKKNKLITFNEEKHKTKLAKELFELSKGGVKTVRTDFQETFYKVVDKTKTPYFRVSYIALDGEKMDNTEIHAMQSKIIEKYNDGASFDFLAQQYSMDKNANRGGDSGWFSQGENRFDFEEIIISEPHNLGDIFAINKPSTSNYFVVLKTFEPKNISEIKVLKIVEALN